MRLRAGAATRSMRTMVQQAAWSARVAAMAALIALAGCVHRHVVIRSDPPGAECFFNGAPIGHTPVEHSFLWYGGHRVTLVKDGYETLREDIYLSPPLHQYVPLDLVAELAPVTVRDRHEFSFVLQPKSDQESDDGAQNEATQERP